jgi:hypothetical protein
MKYISSLGVMVGLGVCSASAGSVIVSQTPVSGGGISRSSQLWQDPGPNGNDLDSDAVCWEDFTLSHPTSISHIEWWGLGACEKGFQLEFWRQDPGTVAYQPLSVFYYGGDHTVHPEPPGFLRFTPADYTVSPGPGGINHYSLDLPTPVSLAANDAANPRWFVGVIGLTQQAYYTWNWAQGIGGSNRTYQFVRGSTRYMFRSLPEGRALLLADLTVAVNGQWTGSIDDAWGNAGNWVGGVPDGVDHTASFATLSGGTPNVVIDAAGKIVGTVTFDSATPYSIGAGTLTLDVSAGQAAINVVSGNHAIASPVALADDATFSVSPADGALALDGAVNAANHTITKSGAGALRVVNVIAPQLNINFGTVAIRADGGNAGASKLTMLVLAGGAAPTATLDLNDNDMIVTNGSYATITAQIAHARNGGTWDSTGLKSSAAAQQPSRATTLGVLLGADYRTLYGNNATFDGFAVAATNTLVKYTWYGDSDFNGRVNFDDYVRTDNGFNNHLTGWLNGDFDLNGSVNFDDYVLIDLAFNTQSGTLGRALGFLDGSDRSSAGISDPALQKVDQHLRQFGQAYADHFLAAVPEPGPFWLIVAALGTRIRRQGR